MKSEQKSPHILRRTLSYSSLASSDKSPSFLCKHIKKILCPCAERSSEGEYLPLDTVVPLDVIDKAVKAVAERRNYGLDDAPAALSVWRWEVRDLSFLQDSTVDKNLPAQRLEQRVQVSAVFVDRWKSLTRIRPRATSRFSGTHYPLKDGKPS